MLAISRSYLNRIVEALLMCLFVAAPARISLAQTTKGAIFGTVTDASGRLVLPRPPDQLIPAERDVRAILPLPIDEESALHVSRLPDLHRDPFDRILVAQAIVHGLTIVTPDPLVSQYPARTTW